MHHLSPAMGCSTYLILCVGGRGEGKREGGGSYFRSCRYCSSDGLAAFPNVDVLHILDPVCVCVVCVCVGG
jgi:hypothetical protein